MEWLGTAAQWANFVSGLMSALSLPLLLIAAIVRVVRTRGDFRRSMGTTGAVLTALALVLVCLVALAAARATDVPLGLTPALVAIALLVAFLSLDDRKFWSGLPALVGVFCVSGFTILFGLSRNFAAPDGSRWYGGRELVVQGGLSANPSVDGWEFAIASMAVLQYGFPLGLSVATAWRVGTRPDLTPLERTGMAFGSASFVAAAFGSAALQSLAFVVGAVLGLPPAVAVAGLAGAVLTLVLVGPGAIDATLVGGRTLASHLPTSLLAVTTSVLESEPARKGLGKVPADPGRSTWRSFVAWAGSNVSWTSKLWLRLLFLLGAVCVLGYFGLGLLTRPSDAREVRFEAIDREVGVGFVAEEALPGSDGTYWLLGTAGEVGNFDPEREVVDRVEVTAVDAATDPADGDLMVLAREDPLRLVEVATDGTTRSIPLADGFSGQVAVSATAVYVAGSGGRIARWDRDGGAPTATVTGPAVRSIEVGERGIWSVHDGNDGQVAVLRDPVTLEGSTIAEPFAASADLPTGDDPRAWSGDDLTIVHDAGSATAVTNDGSDALLHAPVQTPVWSGRGLGGLVEQVEGETVARYDFHYDSITAVLGRRDPWLLAVNDRGTVISTDAVDQSHLARWPGSG